MILNNLLIQAENLANGIIAVKDRIIDYIIDPLVPVGKNRRLIKDKVVTFAKYFSRPLSEKVDEWIERDIITTPNIISISRALMAGPLFLIFTHFDLGVEYQSGPVIWAFISDYIDGVLARKMKLTTDLGAGLDAACDKIFALFVALSYFDQLLYWPINAWAFGILDTILLSLGVLLYKARLKGAYQGKAEVKANWLGKIKFNLQACACICFMSYWTIEGQYFLLFANTFAFGSLVRHLAPKPKTLKTG